MNGIWIIWLISVPILIASFEAAVMLFKASGDRNVWLGGDLPPMARGFDLDFAVLSQFGR